MREAVPPPIPAPAAPPVPIIPGPVGEGPTAVQSGPLPLPAMVFTVSRPRVSAQSEVLPLTGAHPCTLENKGELTLPEAVKEQMGKVRHVLYLAVAPDRNACGLTPAPASINWSGNWNALRATTSRQFATSAFA